MKDNIERADCAVRAVANATGEDYGRTLMYMAACGRKPRCRTPWSVTLAAIKRLGYLSEDWLVKGRTVRTVLKELPEQGGFILDMGGHCAAYKDGSLIDWVAADSRKRVKHVYRVKPK